MKCPNCGKNIHKGQKICNYCYESVIKIKENENSSLLSLEYNVENGNKSKKKFKILPFIKDTFVLLLEIILLPIMLLFYNLGGGFSENTEPNVIGVIIPNINAEYYEYVIDTIEDIAGYYEWEVTVSITQEPGGEAEALEELIGEGVIAVIIDPHILGEREILNLERQCEGAGIPYVLILDEGEPEDYSAASVWCDLEYLGASLAYNTKEGEVYILGGMNDLVNEKIFDGLLYEKKYGLALDDDYNILGISYFTDLNKLRTDIENSLEKYPDIDTFLVLDREYSARAIEILDELGFKGEVFCYMDERTSYNALYNNYSGDTELNQKGMYFLAYDVGYFSLLALADQLIYKVEPHCYRVYSYGW